MKKLIENQSGGSSHMPHTPEQNRVPLPTSVYGGSSTGEGELTSQDLALSSRGGGAQKQTLVGDVNSGSMTQNSDAALPPPLPSTPPPHAVFRSPEVWRER